MRELVAAERAAEQQRAHWRARVEALSVGLARRDGSGALLGDAGPDGVLGALSGLVTVEPDARTAVAAALGELADAVAVDSLDAAVAALRQLRAADAGRADAARRNGRRRERAGTGGRRRTRRRPGGGRRRGARAGREVGRGAGPGARSLAPALRRALHGVVVVDDLDAARTVAAAGFTAVTVEGDVLAAGRASGGSGVGASALDVQAAVDEALAARDGVEEELARLRPALEGARAEEAARLADLNAAREARTAAERRAGAAAAQLGRLEQAARSAGAEAERLRARRDAVEAKRSDALLALEAAEQRLAVAEDEPVDDEPDTGIRDAAADALAGARATEVEARLALRTAEERARAIAGRAESLRRQASAERQARARAAAARAARERGARIAGDRRLGRGDGLRRHRPSRWPPRRSSATPRPPPVPSGSAPWPRCAPRTSRLTALLEKLVDAVHRDEVLRAQSRARLEALTAKVLDDHGLAADDLVDEYGPHVPVPASAAETAEYEAARERGDDVVAPPPMPYDRATQQRRAARAEKDLGAAGPGQPAGTGGVRRAGGALSVPVHPARRPEEHPAGPVDGRPRGRRQDPRRSSPRRTRTSRASSRRCSPRCSPAARAGWS